ncbi:MAG: TIGR01777 family oxidoreductase [Bacteroidota bacterium]
MKKLIIAGGTGFLGQALVSHFKDTFDSIVILSRSEKPSSGKVKYMKWDAATFGDWCQELEGATAIINLCGKSVDCRYTEKNKAIIFSSRLDSTKIIGEAIQKCKVPPALWINGASATIYSYSETEPRGEYSKEIGTGFSVEVCKAWEKVFNGFTLPATRKVNMRISMVMGRTGGVFPVLLNLAKKGLGGTMGKGTQQVSWIHIDDLCNMVDWFIHDTNTNGIYNSVSPNPIVNRKMMRLFRKKVGMPIGLPATEWMLKIGALIIGTETELILKSRYSYPERALEEGFNFKYKTFEECLASL